MLAQLSGQEALDDRLLFATLDVATVNEFDPHPGRVGARRVLWGHRPHHLALQPHRLRQRRHHQREDEVGPYWERTLGADEGAAARDVLRVVREEGVEPAILHLELNWGPGVDTSLLGVTTAHVENDSDPVPASQMPVVVPAPAPRPAPGNAMAAPVRNPYETLGVDRRASADELKSAFRRLAAQHHPDKNQDDDAAAAERFKEINLAYQILSDPEKRAAFDRFGASAFTPGGNAGGGPGFVDLGNLDGIFGDVLEALGIRAGDRGNIRQQVTLSFEEAALGCTRELTYPRLDLCGRCGGEGADPGSSSQRCPTCGGSGRLRVTQGFLPLPVERPCSRCHGSGRIPEVPCRRCRGRGLAQSKHRLAVSIPAGIEAGSTRVVERAGSRVRRDRPPGHLEVVVTVTPHPFFARSGDDLRCRVPVSFTQAALGGDIDVPTLEGQARLHIPAGTQPGSVLRLRGKGVPRRARGGRGDQLVELQVEIPVELTDRARELIAELGDELGDQLTPQRRTFLERLKEWFA